MNDKPLSNCCAAPQLGELDGVMGRCSHCKEMAVFDDKPYIDMPETSVAIKGARKMDKKALCALARMFSTIASEIQKRE